VTSRLADDVIICSASPSLPYKRTPETKFYHQPRTCWLSMYYTFYTLYTRVVIVFKFCCKMQTMCERTVVIILDLIELCWTACGVLDYAFFFCTEILFVILIYTLSCKGGDTIDQTLFITVYLLAHVWSSLIHCNFFSFFFGIKRRSLYPSRCRVSRTSWTHRHCMSDKKHITRGKCFGDLRFSATGSGYRIPPQAAQNTISND